jgi:hypothetical protein
LAATYTGGSGTNDFHLYANGVDVSSGTDVVGGTGTLNSDAGADLILGNNSNLNRSMAGDLAFCGEWNRVLTADEITALGKAFAPSCFRNGLVMDAPLIRDPVDSVNGAYTLTGTTVSDSPRIILCGQ